MPILDHISTHFGEIGCLERWSQETGSYRWLCSVTSAATTATSSNRFAGRAVGDDEKNSGDNEHQDNATTDLPATDVDMQTHLQEYPTLGNSDRQNHRSRPRKKRSISYLTLESLETRKSESTTQNHVRNNSTSESPEIPRTTTNLKDQDPGQKKLEIKRGFRSQVKSRVSDCGERDRG